MMCGELDICIKITKTNCDKVHKINSPEIITLNIKANTQASKRKHENIFMMVSKDFLEKTHKTYQ